MEMSTSGMSDREREPRAIEDEPCGAFGGILTGIVAGSAIWGSLLLAFLNLP